MAAATIDLTDASTKGDWQASGRVQLWVKDVPMTEFTTTATAYKIFTIPAGATVLGAWGIVQTAAAGATTPVLTDLGDATTAGKWHTTDIALGSVGATSQSIVTVPATYTAADEVQATVTFTGTFTAGVVRFSMLICDTFSSL